MKNLITLVFAAIFSLSAYADVGPKGHSTALKYDGTVDTSTLEKHFINVVNNKGSSIAAGSLVYLDVTADDGASVTTGTTDSQTPLCIMVAACADNAACSCQTYGLYSAALFDAEGGNAVAGAPFFLSTANAGYISEGALGADNIPAGIFYDAASASAAVEVFIKLR